MTREALPSLHKSGDTATGACEILLFAAGDRAVPEWIHILPTGAISTADGRGPYHLNDPAAVIAASLAAHGKIAVDENHSTDLAAGRGEPSPARGWIVEIEARQDGLWGRVEWTPAGKVLMEEKAYLGISPVIWAGKDDNVIHSIARVSLTNVPNMSAIRTLHQKSSENVETPMKEELAKLLGLDPSVSDGVILNAVRALTEEDEAGEDANILQPVLNAAGLGDDADADELIATIADLRKAAADGVSVEDYKALNARVGELRQRESERVIDDFIRSGRAGLKPLRDHYVTRHMADPDGVEKEIGAMPVVSGEAILNNQERNTESGGLSEDEKKVCRLMGQSEEDYKAARDEMNKEVL